MSKTFLELIRREKHTISISLMLHYDSDFATLFPKVDKHLANPKSRYSFFTFIRLHDKFGIYNSLKQFKPY